MPTRYGRQCIMALSAATLLVACKPKDNGTTDTSTAAGAVATGSDSANRAKTDSSAATANMNASNGWTDAQILAFATAATDLTKDAHNELQDLTTKPKGADWDKDFVDKEIDGHKKVLDKLQDAKKATTNPELGEMLTKATAKVQEHLQKAQALKDSTLKS